MSESKKLCMSFMLLIGMIASLFVTCMLSGCKQQISEHSARSIADATLRHLFRDGVHRKHKLSDVQYKGVQMDGDYWSFIYGFIDNPRDEIVITIDHSGNIINVATWIDRDIGIKKNKKESQRSKNK